MSSQPLPYPQTNPIIRLIAPGEAEALTELGEPIVVHRRGGQALLKFTGDYYAVVGPDDDLPPEMRELIATCIPDLHLFRVKWETFEETLVTKFLRIL